METVKRAAVEWMRFGENSSGIFGEEFHDKGERLAVAICPWCSARHSFSYAEFMHSMRKTLICNSCSLQYSLSSVQKNSAPKKEEIQQPQIKKNSPSRRDTDGRRDWGNA